MLDNYMSSMPPSSMPKLGASLTLALASLLLLPHMVRAQGAPISSAHYASACHIINSGESVSAKTGEVTQYYAADCELKYVSGEKVRVVWSGRLTLPMDASLGDVTDAIADWIVKERPKLIAADRKGKK